MEEIKYPNNIAMLRRMRGFTQAYIAEQIGVSRPKYIEIERGLKELTISQVNKLKEILNVEFDDLVGINASNLDYSKYINETARPVDHESLKLFEDKIVRSVWDDKEEKWWFSVADVVVALTNSKKARDYWYRLKKRVYEEEKFQLSTICRQLKIQSSDGKFYTVDAADTKGILRIIQSIPSKKAEPFKQWLAKVGSERIDQMVDPEKSIEQALVDYKRLGYSDNWINQRLKSIEIRKDLTDAWGDHGVFGQQYATLTDIIYQTWAGKTAKEYKEFKGLKKENLRDNMTNEELVMNMLAELSTTNITNSRNPKTFTENASCAIAGGNIAKNAKEQLEAATGKKVVTKISGAKQIKEIEA